MFLFNYLLYVIILSLMCLKIKINRYGEIRGEKKLKLKRFYERIHEHIKRNVKGKREK